MFQIGENNKKKEEEKNEAIALHEVDAVVIGFNQAHKHTVEWNSVFFPSKVLIKKHKGEAKESGKRRKPRKRDK